MEVIPPHRASVDSINSENATVKLTQRNSLVDNDNEFDRLDGMRREWNFTISIRHKEARAELQLVPQWKATFIDLERELCRQRTYKGLVDTSDVEPVLDGNIEIVQQIQLEQKRRKLEEENKGGLFIPWYAYTDDTRAKYIADDDNEMIKHIELLYVKLKPEVTPSTEKVSDNDQHLNCPAVSEIPEMSLKQFCKKSIQHILQNCNVFSINGETNLNNIHIKDKMNFSQQAPENIRLAGNNCFIFRYASCNRKECEDIDYWYAIGTIVNSRGYLATVCCNNEIELESYFLNVFLRHYRNPARFQLDVDVIYAECTYSVLKEQQTASGELYYFDKDASMSFSLPMHPMQVRPDFSPIQTVGVGSMSCMTLELEVHQKLCDAPVEEAEALAGMPTYKSNSVVLFLDVENLGKMGYPSVMSINQYSQLKAKKMTDIFRDAKLIGQALHVNLGPRSGISTTFTLSYDGSSKHRGVVKGMLASTIVANLGITALYFTKLGQGLFDAHLYLFQHLLRNIKFHSEHELRGKFSRFQIRNVRLTEQDMMKAYAAAPPDDNGMELHIRALRASNDGKSDGSLIVSEMANIMTVDRHTLVAVPNNSVDNERRQSINSGDDVNDIDDTDSIVSTRGIPHLAACEDMTIHSEAFNTSDDGSGDVAAVRQSRSVSVIIIGEELRQKSPSPKIFEKVAEMNTAQGNEVKRGLLSRDDSVIERVNGRSISDIRDSDRGENEDEQLDIDALQKEQDMKFLNSMTIPDRITGYKSLNAINVEEVISNDDGTLYYGPSLRDIYDRCCELNACRHNSYIYNKLPLNSRFTNSVEELDLTSNYLGNQGFQAVLMFIEYLPRLTTIIFDNMSLDNEDVRNLCECLCDNCGPENNRITARSASMRSCLTSISIKNNPKITLPSTKHLTRLIKMNTAITSIFLSGTSLGHGLIAKIERDAANNGRANIGNSSDNLQGSPCPSLTKETTIMPLHCEKPPIKYSPNKKHDNGDLDKNVL